MNFYFVVVYRIPIQTCQRTSVQDKVIDVLVMFFDEFVWDWSMCNKRIQKNIANQDFFFISGVS